MKRWMTVLIMLILVAGCQSEPEATLTPTPDPLRVAIQAGEAMQQVKTLHFNFLRDGAPAFIDAEETLIFRSAEGDYVAPDQLQASVKVLAGAFVTQVDTVIVGQDQWLTNLLTGEWEEMPAAWELDPSLFFDPQVGIPNLLANGLTSVSLQGPLTVEEMDGEYWYVLGETAGDEIATMSGGLVPPGPVEVEAWIDPSTFLVHRLRLVLPETDPEEPTVWVLGFSDFDQELVIERPGAAND